jgi:hypothetical protein
VLHDARDPTLRVGAPARDRERPERDGAQSCATRPTDDTTTRPVITAPTPHAFGQ